LPRPPTGEWSKNLRQSETPKLNWSTIHEAKGREYAAVCVVFPPDRGNADHTSKLFEVWENRTEDEAKRVIYVGVTRAEHLVAIAVPAGFSERLIRILEGAGVRFEVSQPEQGG
jgi:superfamily I DNA/RNA helicase